MEENTSERHLFYSRFQDKSNRYIIGLLHHVVLSLSRHEEKVARNGLRAPYKSADLERAIQASADSRAELLNLLYLAYTDPYLNMLQAQNSMNSTIMMPRQVEPAPMERSVQSSPASSIFDEYTPKSNMRKYNHLFGGKARRTRRRRGTSRRMRYLRHRR
jgi:hypothetical protein